MTHDMMLKVSTGSPGWVVIEFAERKRLNLERKMSCSDRGTLELPSFRLAVILPPSYGVSRKSDRPPVG